MIEQLPYEVHELATLIPAPSAEQQRELENDIEKNGVQEPVILLDKKILDGRSRSLACVRLKIDIPTENYNARKHGEPLAFVISKNIKRRHLSPSQLAAFAAETLPAFVARAKERQKAAGGDKRLPPTGGKRSAVDTEEVTADGEKPKPGLTAAQDAAKATGASPRSVERAARIKKADPAKLKEVAEGKKTLRKAEKELAAGKKKQAEYDAALARMKKIGGEHTQALIRGIARKSRLTRHADVIKFASLADKDEMERVAYLVCTAGATWSLQKCIDFENRKKLTERSTMHDLTFMAVAEKDWHLKADFKDTSGCTTWTVELYLSKQGSK